MSKVQVKRTVETIKEFTGLGQKIKSARESDGRTLTQICRDCGVSRSYWYQLEGEDLRAPVTEQMIRKIEKVLGTDFGIKFDN